jgi:FkbM family methyltransferase
LLNRHTLAGFFNSVLSIANIRVVSEFSFNRLEQQLSLLSAENSAFKLKERITDSRLPPNFSKFLLETNFSYSQINQDLFVQFLFKGKGFYCEVGGGDGVLYSNSKALEDLGWAGVIVEPARSNIEKIRKNRKAVVIPKLAWSSTGEALNFVETKNLELSTIDFLLNADSNFADRTNVIGRYVVKTITLTDILREVSAPPTLEYLSIDTEGSELEILKGLDFTQYKPLVITCEHNFTPQREVIHDLLKERGYRRYFPEFSLQDDWYLEESFANSDYVAILLRD